MEIYAKGFWLPKHGNTKNEYEDAFDVAPDKRRFAVADGATETSFSGIWAKQLVRAFTSGNLSVPLAIEDLQPLQAKWQRIVHRKPLPWYAEEKAGAGACATFLGLELLQQDSDAETEYIWRATAAGDSCLVQVRGNEIVKAFPLAESGSFTNSPILLCSSSVFNESSKEVVVTEAGSLSCDDIFFLMTDALACWFFKEREEGNQPWNTLRDLETDGHIAFEELISELRSNHCMKNDDVTLLRIDILG